MGNLQVILQQTVKNVGMIGDVVDVAPGFYRNYLAPRHLAFLANPKSLAQLEHHKRIVEAKKTKAKAVASEMKVRMEGQPLEFVHAAGSGDKLFGSITPLEIAVKLREQGYEVERKYIYMEAPLKTLGEHTVQVKLHPDVTATLKILVKRKEEEKKEKKKTPVKAAHEAKSEKSKTPHKGVKKPATKKKTGS